MANEPGSISTIQRKKGQALKDGDIENIVGTMVDEAHAFAEEELSDIREKATDYYKGRPFGNEEEGRSQVVSTVLRDSVRKILPSLMRVFFGGDNTVELRPDGADDEEVAAQRTQYLNYIFREDNPGFKETLSVFKDMMKQKLGFMGWRWDDAEEVEVQEYTGVTEEQYSVFLADEECEVEVEAQYEAEENVPPTYDIKVTRTRGNGRIRVFAIPPEEVVWNSSARDFRDARLIAYDREVMASDVAAMGFDIDLDELLELSAMQGTLQYKQEKLAREFDEQDRPDTESMDPHTSPLRFTEAYVVLDKEGDGTAALYKVVMVGDTHRMLECVGVSHVPIAAFPFDPEPHTIIPLDLFDYTKDIQEVKSAIERGTLDSLSLALFPRTEVVETAVNIKDLLNTEVGGIIRTRAPGMIREITHRFVGDATLPVLQHWDGVLEERLGLSRASAGLDADALQSSTQAAVSATINAAQQQLELTARITAEYGMTQVFRGLQRMAMEHQDFERQVRLRSGRWVTEDPRAWKAELDVTISTGLGTGLVEQKIEFLLGMAAKQEAILQSMGPVNPLCTIKQYRYTLAKLSELGGHPDASKFWLEITDEQLEALMQADQEQEKNPSDPNAAIAQAEVLKAQAQAMKAQSEIEIKRQELAMQQREMELRDDRERDKLAADSAIRIKELELRFAQNLSEADIRAQIDMLRAQIDSQTRKDVAEIQAEAKANESKPNQ